MRKKIRLGEMLVEQGLVSREQLDRALTEHKKAKLKLGQYLVRSNICREEDLVDVLSRQLRIPKYNPAGFPLDLGLAELVPYEIARKYETVPLERRGNLLAVGMTDPLDIEAQDSLEVYINMEVEPVVCTEAEYDQLFSTMYGFYKGLDDIMESVESTISTEDTDEEAPRDMDVSAMENQADQAPVIKLVNSLIAQAVSEKASDIHISPEKEAVQTRFRMDGKLREVSTPPKKLMPALVSRIKILANMDIAITRVPQDGRFTVIMNQREINIRVSCIPTIYGENVVMRLLDMSAGAYTLDDLGMNSQDLAKMESVIQKPYGMILSTGPTGSGKSTSLYAILRRIKDPEVNIITLEDPVEYRVEGIRQVQLNRRAGMTFASGLRSILRQDPDVIMVGEIRDSETANIAVQSAMTGHRVLSTVHTNDAAGAINRFIDMGIEPFLVASTLLVSFAQRLLRRVCPECAEPYDPPRESLKALGLENSSCNFLRGRGCYKCMNSGYRGRTAVFEILKIDDEIRDMVVKKASSGEITRHAVQTGNLRTLSNDAAEKVCQGRTTVEEAIAVVMT
ncbi:GspE/PulE family protein [Desulfonatronospira sp.]|uniref:GspE/PulE family protein n=1 Tax=Desulfonatronospira sp. TaxID=1962951 RepID=UPI0025BBFC70|nr:GspE/PulE family protein [Desulfonatronospira sp.]